MEQAVNQETKGSDVRRSIWDLYKSLSPEGKNDFCLEVMQQNLGDQRFLLYGWPVQRLYSRYADEFLPDCPDLSILELGPGDNLMTTALWMLEKRVGKVTMLDKFKGRYVDSASYHKNLFELVRTIKLLPRDGFNNFYPFDGSGIDRLESAIQLKSDGTVEFDRERIDYRIIDDFSMFPFNDSSFDYIYSHAALEHYEDPGGAVAEMFRTLAPGGLMVHQIDMRDHRDFNDPYRFLEIPSSEWGFGDLAHSVNQWRSVHYREAFLSKGFSILSECRVRREPEKAVGVNLAPEFREIPMDELLITGMVFVLRKSGFPEGRGR